MQRFESARRLHLEPIKSAKTQIIPRILVTDAFYSEPKHSIELTRGV